MLRSAHDDLQRASYQALTAHQNGIENVVAFLTENVTELQLEQLAALMDERKWRTHRNVLRAPKGLFFLSYPVRG
jgi:hypothetical protein